MNRGINWRAALIATLWAALAATPLFARQTADVPYAVFALPPLGGEYSYGWTLDESGNVVGSAYLPGLIIHAALWRENRRPLDLGTLGGAFSTARGINRDGCVVGKAQAPGQTGLDFTAFAWRNGHMTSLGYLGTGDFSEAYGINDLNQIVGRSTIDMSQYPPVRAFVWENGRMTELPITPEYNNSEAIAINNTGLIVGQASSYEYYVWRPVIWRDGQIIDLGTFRSDNRGLGICIDVNDAGDVVGYVESSSSSFSDFCAFVYRNGVKHRLPEKQGWTDSYAWSINENRQIVGAALTESLGSQPVACVWEWGKPVEYLSDVIPPRSNWWFEIAIHNNNAGQITGHGFRLNDREHPRGFLLTPVYPTMELSEPNPGVANTDNTLTVTGATPGSTVAFLYSRHGGGTAIPGCTLQTNCLQLDSPKVIGRATADAEGQAAITAFVPPAAAGETALIQACVKDECAVSQLVVHEFE